MTPIIRRVWQIYVPLLDTLLLKYTDKHPEIVRLRKLIEKLEKRLRVELAKMIWARGSPAVAQDAVYDKILMQLEVQQKGVRLNIANLENEKNELKKIISQYEKWVAAAPIREAEWSSLTQRIWSAEKTL